MLVDPQSAVIALIADVESNSVSELSLNISEGWVIEVPLDVIRSVNICYLFKSISAKKTLSLD